MRTVPVPDITQTSDLKYGTRERLDQDHHHPKLEVPRLTCLGWELNPGLRGGRRVL
jgi:hypothetical protein